MITMGVLPGESLRPEAGEYRRRRTTTRLRTMGILDTPERDQPRAARRFVLAVAALWVMSALVVDPVGKGTGSLLVTVELRLVGAAVLASALVVLRRRGLPGRQLWGVIAIAG